MQYAWGAFKGAVQEFNQAILADSDEEGGGEDIQTQSSRRVRQPTTSRGGETWNDWSWESLDKTLVSQKSTGCTTDQEQLDVQSVSKRLPLSLGVRGKPLGDSASKVVGLVGSVLPTSVENIKALKTSIVAAVESNVRFQLQSHPSISSSEDRRRKEHGDGSPLKSQFEEFMEIARENCHHGIPKDQNLSVLQNNSPFELTNVANVLIEPLKSPIVSPAPEAFSTQKETDETHSCSLEIHEKEKKENKNEHEVDNEEQFMEKEYAQIDNNEEIFMMKASSEVENDVIICKKNDDEVVKIKEPVVLNKNRVHGKKKQRRKLKSVEPKEETLAENTDEPRIHQQFPDVTNCDDNSSRSISFLHVTEDLLSNNTSKELVLTNNDKHTDFQGNGMCQEVDVHPQEIRVEGWETEFQYPGLVNEGEGEQQDLEQVDGHLSLASSQDPDIDPEIIEAISDIEDYEWDPLIDSPAKNNFLEDGGNEREMKKEQQNSTLEEREEESCMLTAIETEGDVLIKHHVDLLNEVVRQQPILKETKLDEIEEVSIQQDVLQDIFISEDDVDVKSQNSASGGTVISELPVLPNQKVHRLPFGSAVSSLELPEHEEHVVCKVSSFDQEELDVAHDELVVMISRKTDDGANTMQVIAKVDSVTDIETDTFVLSSSPDAVSTIMEPCQPSVVDLQLVMQEDSILNHEDEPRLASVLEESLNEEPGPYVSEEFMSAWKLCKSSMVNRLSANTSTQGAIRDLFNFVPASSSKIEKFCTQLMQMVSRDDFLVPSETCSSNLSTQQETECLIERKNQKITELTNEINRLNEHIALVTSKAAETFQRYREEVETQQEKSNQSYEKDLKSYRERYDVLMEQYRVLQQEGKELSQKHAGSESAQSVLHERIESLEMENDDLAEQIESWQRAHAQVTESYHRLNSEVTELKHRCVSLEGVAEELEESKRIVEENKTISEEYTRVEAELKEKNELVTHLESDLSEARNVIERLHKLMEDISADQDARVAGLEMRLSQSQREIADTRSKLSMLRDQSNEINNVQEKCEKLKRELESAHSLAAVNEQHNEVLSGALRKVLDRLHAKAEESDYLVDRRVIESKLKDYYKLLTEQGVLNVMGKPKEEMIYVLCEACSLPPELKKVCLGIQDSTEALVKRTRAAGLSKPSQDTTSDKVENSDPQEECNDQEEHSSFQPNRRPISHMFLDFLESEAAL